MNQHSELSPGNKSISVNATTEIGRLRLFDSLIASGN